MKIQINIIKEEEKVRRNGALNWVNKKQIYRCERWRESEPRSCWLASDWYGKMNRKGFENWKGFKRTYIIGNSLQVCKTSDKMHPLNMIFILFPRIRTRATEWWIGLVSERPPTRDFLNSSPSLCQPNEMIEERFGQGQVWLWHPSSPKKISF